MTMTYAKVAVNTSESVPFASNRGGACIDAVHRRGLVAVGVEIKTGQKASGNPMIVQRQPGLANSFAWLTRRRESCNYD
jgi:hypothetical protein